MKPIKSYFRFLQSSQNLKATIDGEVVDIYVTRDAITIQNGQTFEFAKCGLGIRSSRRATIFELTNIETGENVVLHVSGSAAENLVQRLHRYLQNYPDNTPY